MERNLALEVVRATEAAALAVARFIGKGDERPADRAACDAMRKALNSIAIDGKIVIGEGEQGATDLLYNGEIVGIGAGPEVDVALDALEGPLICAIGRSQRAVVHRAGRARQNAALPRYLHGQNRLRPARPRRDRSRSLADRQSEGAGRGQEAFTSKTCASRSSTAPAMRS